MIGGEGIEINKKSDEDRGLVTYGIGKPQPDLKFDWVPIPEESFVFSKRFCSRWFRSRPLVDGIYHSGVTRVHGGRQKKDQATDITIQESHPPASALHHLHMQAALHYSNTEDCLFLK